MAPFIAKKESKPISLLQQNYEYENSAMYKKRSF
jgi:hypothetical protein